MRNYYICKVKKFIDTYAMYRQIIAFIAVVTLAAAPLICRADSVDAAPLHWRIGLEGTAAGVPGTNAYLRGDNPSEQKISSYFGTALRGDFSFGSSTRYGRLYPDVYQGIGLEWGTFCKKRSARNSMVSLRLSGSQAAAARTASVFRLRMAIWRCNGMEALSKRH